MSLSAPGEQPLVFDLGTGLRYFGARVQQNGQFSGTALLSHFHWDHTQGLPFFVPILAEGAHLDVYAPRQDDGRSVAEVFAEIIRPPMFPVAIDDLPGSFAFHDVGDDEFRVGGFDIMSRHVPHVGPTVGFRVTWQGLSVGYVSDHQQPIDGPFTLSDSTRELLDGVDLLIHDAQYSAEEFPQKRTWGHCTPEFAAWVAGEVGAKQLALYHHDPVRTDDELDELVERFGKLTAKCDLDVFAASQGLTVDVG